MYIKQVIIDGFKSYANRTVIDGWDPQFNAITGLNGSGKSNVLDAICFVLGISNLAQVRAQDFKDLVYKQGQSRVTKATVSIVFDNSDRASSPINQEDNTEITVTRQIVIGGRNKYMINGATVQQQAVQNLFHSVSLNVNNPHFLIMQGRITKVCGMKPHELLSLIEEATGTRMYEDKRKASLALLQKKQGKVDQINDIITNELMATMEKLKEEKARFVRWQAVTGKVDRLRKLNAVAQFMQLTDRVATLEEDIQHCEAQLAARLAQTKESERELQAVDTRIREVEHERARDASVKEASDRVQAAAKDKDVVDLELAALDAARGKEDAKRAKLEAALVKLEAKAAKLGQMRADKEAAAAALQEELEGKRDRLAALQASLTGMSGDGGAGGSAGQLMELQRQLGDAEAEAGRARGQLGVLEAAVAEGERRMQGEQGRHGQMEQEHSQLATRLAADQASLTARAEQCCREHNFAVSAVHGPVHTVSAQLPRAQQAVEALEHEHRQAEAVSAQKLAYLGAKLHFQFAQWPGYQEGSVKGVFAKLIELKDPSWAFALEVAAGGRLFNVVVDNAHTSRQLIEKGQLRERVNVIPLEQIRAKTIPAGVLQLAAQLVGDKAHAAVSLVNFDPAVRRAAEFVLGGSFICADSYSAERLTFHRDIRTRSVTAQGDVFDPQGTLTGGSKPQSAGALVALQQAQADTQRAEAVGKRLREAQRVLAAVEAVEQARGEVARLAASVEQLQRRLDGTAFARARDHTEGQRKAADAAREALRAAEASCGKLSARIQDVQSVVAAVAGGDRQATKKLEAERKSLQGTVQAQEAAVQRARDDVDRVVVELEHAAAQTERAKEEVAAAAAELRTLAERRDELAETGETRAAALAAAEEVLRAREAEAEGQVATLKLLQAEKASLAAAVDEAARDVRRIKTDAAAAGKERDRVNAGLNSLNREHKWIVAEQERFGEPGSDYDLSNRSAEAIAQELAVSEREAKELSLTVNRKVMAKFEATEREFDELLAKRNTIEEDKGKIEAVIAKLDVKKREAIEAAWTKVNASFGAIFSILLPGAGCRLQKHERPGEGVVGLEMRVTFADVEKQSLAELSGGQRSLIALSLILALLRFRPAPMYILDEVDAALDLAHTQNIGVMLKKHFPQSQFVVVSLKEGMFNNANVLFRTKFVDGVSTVTCTRNNQQ